MKKGFFILVVLAIITSESYSQNVMKTPQEVGKAVTDLIKNCERIDYAMFSSYFVNVEDCKKLSEESTDIDQKIDFQETAKALSAGNYYKGYENFVGSLPNYLREQGYTLHTLRYVDFWYDEIVINGISCIVGIVIMWADEGYLMCTPCYAVRINNGFKLTCLGENGFSWSSGVTEVREDGTICCDDFNDSIHGSKNGCLKFKGAYKDSDKIYLGVF